MADQTSTAITYAETVKDDNGKDGTVITENAYITRANLGSMKFEFPTPGDITDSITKSSGKKTGSGFSGKSGRIAYSAAVCKYPDGSSSGKVALTDCVVDHRPKAGEDYGRSYMSVGIPQEYCDKIMRDGKSGSSINIKLPVKAVAKDRYYWITVNLDKLGADKTSFIYLDSKGEHQQSTYNIREFMQSIEKSVTITLICVVSASHTTESITVKPDIASVTYNLGFKPYEIYINGVASVQPPVFESKSMDSESVVITQQLVASDELAALAMSRLSLI